MAVDRLKFRCYRCTQLLAVAPTKVGSTVNCPKCKAELLVPLPTAENSQTIKSDEPPPLIPPELADLRPEDIRIEAAVFESLASSPKVEPERAEEPRFAGAPTSLDDSPSPQIVEPPPIADGSSLPKVERATRPSSTTLGINVSEPASRSEPVIAISALDIETSSLARPGVEKRTIREVVLPAGVVLAWSLFVLIALGMTFIAGLLVGHYIWTPGG